VIDLVQTQPRYYQGWVFVFFVLVLLSSFGCNKIIPQPEAEKIAKRELLRYCKENGVPFEKFCETGVASHTDYPWFFHFSKNESPKHRVDVLINWNGTTETFFEVEGSP